MDSQDAVFKALADPTRREILNLLFVRDMLTKNASRIGIDSIEIT